MKSGKLKQKIKECAAELLGGLYSDPQGAAVRIINAIESFEKKYGADRDVSVFSTPGRSEIIGNHTDHNNGCVIASAIDRDIIAVAAKNDLNTVRFLSEGYAENVIELDRIADPNNFEKYTSSALIGGVARAFADNNLSIGGYDAYSTTEVLKGSGLSSSAAFEVMIGNIFSHLYNGGVVENSALAKFAQYAENEYFGKPCGLMDQMACAVGGFVYIDFADKSAPLVEKIDFSMDRAGYKLCIVNTGGNHADLNEDYASVPTEMLAAAAICNEQTLRGVSFTTLLDKSLEIREKLGDRALLRSAHFIRENERANAARAALLDERISDFFLLQKESGRSSFEYLQNVYTNKNPKEQGISLALMLTDTFGEGIGSYRVHGGGFAGTIQAFVESSCVADYTRYMERIFGEGAVMKLSVRAVGACKIV